MKYLFLPLNLISFWYSQASETFVRMWRNLILMLEEDLAVGLMWKLLFVPLFHDSTFVGRILSFVFRLGRIIVGLFAFSLSSVLVFSLAIFWLLLPLLALTGTLGIYSKALFVLGTGLFLIHVILHPHKKVWQLGADAENDESVLWKASLVKKKDLSINNIISSFDVSDLLMHLEVKKEQLPKLADTKGREDKLIVTAYNLAKSTSAPYIGPAHFFLSLLQNTMDIDRQLLKLDLHLQDFRQCLKYLDQKKQTWRMVNIWDDDFSVHHLKGINRGWLGSPTPFLDAIAEDMTKTAARIGFGDFIGRAQTLSQIISLLSEPKSRSVILVGPAGSGKTALIRFLAKQIVCGDAPEALATKRIVLLDLTKLLSGMKTQGELADRIKAIFEEVEYAGNVAIVIEEIHQLGEGEVGSSMNLYSLMQPFLESGNFQFIGTTEMENYNSILEKNSAFARLFTKVELAQANADETLEVLESRVIQAERKTGARVTLMAMKKAVYLGEKVIHDRCLPDSAISVLEEGFSRAENGWVTSGVIEQIVSARVKMPLPAVNEAEKIRLLNLEEEIHKKMIDQDMAVRAVCDTLRRSATGLRDENRPVGSFLFVGPTGVGKTELAKILSQIYYGQSPSTNKTDGAFIRFDMSEYQTPESVSRLIGTSGQAGFLTREVSNRPFSLVLLDEFEKADPKILTLFLQVFDDGRLTDASGKTVNFTDTIIIATSNAGSLTIARGLQAGKNFQEIDKQVHDELLSTFRPELINRFDEVVLFKPLSKEDLQKIVCLKLGQLRKQMEDKGFLIDFDENLIASLAVKGFDPVLGARPLRRLIQDTLEAQLSRMILQNQLVKGQKFLAGVSLMK